MIPSICIRLNVQVNNINPNSSMHYCNLLPQGDINRIFLEIAKKISELHPDISFVPNGECPWTLYADYQKCPFYLPPQ